MRGSLTASTILHAVVLAFGLFTLSAPAPMAPDMESVAVDIVPIEDVPQVVQGDKKSPMRDKPAPKPTQRPDIVPDAQKVGENSVDTEKAPTPEARPKPVEMAKTTEQAPTPVEKPATEDVPKPKEKPTPAPATEVAPAEQPKQEVKPDPVKLPEPKPEPVKEQKPAPKPVEQTAAIEPKPEVKPDAVADAISAEQPTETVQLPNSAPAPDARPKPAQAETAKAPDRKDSEKPVKEASSRRKSDDKEFNADEISALLDKQKPSGGGAKRSTQQASLGGERNTGAKLSQSEMDGLRQKLSGCWSIPAGVDDAALLKVTVRFHLDRSGMLEGRPEIIKGGAAAGPGRTAAESAVRAVQKCAPFNLAADKYDAWSEVVVNFDPSDMF